MNNTYDKRLIAKSKRNEKNETEERKYLEEDGETGSMKVNTEGEFVRKHKQYRMENCITDTKGRMLEIRKELYPEETVIQWTMKEIKRILLEKLRGRNIVMHKDGLNRNLIILV